MAFHYYPEDYKSYLSLTETEKAILDIKDFFQTYLSAQLKLRRVTAPLYLKEGTGLNDDLNGVEKPVKFKPRNIDTNVEIVQSLAKWKRMMLADYGIEKGYGLYTDMNAIRPDEEIDNLHSFYVDQWDWELVMDEKDRNLSFLKNVVEKIYSTMVATEFLVYESYPEIKPILPEKITFIHSQNLLEMYPEKTPSERENLAAEKYGAIFIIGIGANLSDEKPHDGRAPDYDDWITENEDGYLGLNGDLIVWHPMIKRAFEISSMGIRVNKESLLKQLKIRNCNDRKDLLFHKRLLNGELPQTIGGGIGQSRLCMFFLRKVHIGEVQASVWTDEIIENCKKVNIVLM
ncbi:MAG TPA: aspartate--ammonia ligase [Exilispira sp.]|nr:aspartate--ammonia ligase [Exilispira sp.]